MKYFLMMMAPWMLPAILAAGSAWVLFDMLRDSWKELCTRLRMRP